MVAGMGALGEADEVAKRQWTLRILGGFSLTDQKGAEAQGLGRLDRALLTYLVLSSQQRHARARLAELLWPDRSEAAHSLSVSLATLRRVLGDKDGDIVGMKSDPLICHFENIDVDALALQRLVKLATPQALEEAETLYSGDLLEGLEVRSEEFDRWLVPERMRLQGVVIEGLRLLMRHREQSGDLEKATETGLRILQFDNFIEEAHRTIISALLRTGQRAAARKHAEYCENLLTEAGIAPEPETRRLITASRRGGEPGEDRPKQAPPLPAKPAAQPPEPVVPPVVPLTKDIWSKAETPAGGEPRPGVPAEPHAQETEQARTPERQTSERVPPASLLQHIRLLLIVTVASLATVLAAIVGAFWNDP